MEPRKATTKNSVRYTVLGTIDRRRWLMEGDQVTINDVEVTGWNTRVYLKVDKLVPNEFIPPGKQGDFAGENDLGYIDLKNYVVATINNDALAQLFKEM